MSSQEAHIATLVQGGHEGTGIDVWATLIEELGHDPEDPKAAALVQAVRGHFAARRAFGIAKYERPLRPHDGRDTLVDILQEALDGLAYSRKGVAEGGEDAEGLDSIRALFLELTFRLTKLIARRQQAARS